MERACVILLLFLAGNLVSAADNLTRAEWKADGVTREALIYAPATARTVPTPVVFAFHGHGGTMRQAATQFAYHKPEFKQHMKPKPVLHVAGENDPLVKFAWQQRTIDELRKINGCGEGKPWGEHCTMYPSRIGTPVVAYIHSGGHLFLDDVPLVIVKFFKQYAKT